MGGMRPVTLLTLTATLTAILSAATPPIIKAAEPVEITGSVERHDSVYVLRADLRAIRRLSDGGDVGGSR